MNNDKVFRTAFDRVHAEIAKPIGIALGALLLLATWGLLHRYKGLALDGELYAFQAMSRLNPALRSDIYLMGNSQDAFTLFSPLYAMFIRGLGLWNASVTLFALCTTAFLAGAWSVARNLWDADRAWLAAATCVVIVGSYGAYSVFSYSETYLTARSMAEAMVVIALACHLRGFRWLSWPIAMAAMLIHPLMALPGLLLLFCLSLPILYALLGALAGVLAALTIAWLSPHIPHAPRFLMLITGEWLEMVRERSQYVFLQLWRLRDWETHGSVILSLAIATLATDDPRVRRLCQAGMLVGATGLIVALIASSIGPVAILLQGQAWRWFWLTGFISVLTLAPTALRLWKEAGCGRVCAALLVASWTFPPVDGTLLAAAALCLWLARRHVQSDTGKFMRLLAYAMIAAVLAWTMANMWSVCTNPPVGTNKDLLLIERLRSIYALQIPALIVAWLGFLWLRAGINLYVSIAVGMLLCSLCCFILRGSLQNNSPVGSAAEISSLSKWRETIPASSNVLIFPETKSAAFIWFSLQRPSYLTMNQSAGIIFSRELALEVLRRSNVLLPVMEPSWKIMSQLTRAAQARAAPRKDEEQPRPLTKEQLSTICRDQQLGFVIAKEQLGFGAIQNGEPGRWKEWNLYDCSRVRQELAG